MEGRCFLEEVWICASVADQKRSIVWCEGFRPWQDQVVRASEGSTLHGEPEKDGAGGRKQRADSAHQDHRPQGSPGSSQKDSSTTRECFVSLASKVSRCLSSELPHSVELDIPYHLEFLELRLVCMFQPIGGFNTCPDCLPACTGAGITPAASAEESSYSPLQGLV